MSLLDFDETYKPPFKPKTVEKEVEWNRPNTRKYNKQLLSKSGDNFEELQNLGHKEVSEDYSDEIEKL